MAGSADDPYTVSESDSENELPGIVSGYYDDSDRERERKKKKRLGMNGEASFGEPYSTHKQLARWAFTKWVDHWPEDEFDKRCEAFRKGLAEWAKRWVFQLELSPLTKRLHFQGRVDVKGHQLRQGEAVKRLGEGAFVRAEVTPNAEASSFYCMKEESRVKGPWSDKDQKQPNMDAILKDWTHAEPNKVQRTIKNMMESQDKRQILIIIDREGGSGKTTLAMQEHGLGRGIRLPCTLESPHKMMQFLHGLLRPGETQHRSIWVDVARAIDYTPKQWSTWLIALEEIKNGYVYDERYSAKTTLFPWPKICVFCNAEPPRAMLSADRWVVYYVVKGELYLAEELE